MVDYKSNEKSMSIDMVAGSWRRGKSGGKRKLLNFLGLGMFLYLQQAKKKEDKKSEGSSISRFRTGVPRVIENATNPRT